MVWRLDQRSGFLGRFKNRAWHVSDRFQRLGAVTVPRHSASQRRLTQHAHTGVQAPHHRCRAQAHVARAENAHFSAAHRHALRARCPGRLPSPGHCRCLALYPPKPLRHRHPITVLRRAVTPTPQRCVVSACVSVSLSLNSCTWPCRGHPLVVRH